MVDQFGVVADALGIKRQRLVDDDHPRPALQQDVGGGEPRDASRPATTTRSSSQAASAWSSGSVVEVSVRCTGG